MREKIPKYKDMTQEEQAQVRAIFKTKYGILKEAWPNYAISDFGDDTALEIVHAQYDIFIRHIRINQDVDQYKVYMVVIWLIVEIFCCKVGLNIAGFTIVQMKSMSKYQRLLIELGEINHRSASVDGYESNWPVEYRLIFMTLINAVVFLIIKILANYVGEGAASTIVEAISSFLTGTPAQPGKTLFGVENDSSGIEDVPRPQDNPLNGVDLPGLIANLGTMLINKGVFNGAASAAAPQQSKAAPKQTPTQGTGNYRPSYQE